LELQNFLAAIQGDEELAAAGKKVVKSGPKDHVFIFFADHGGPGMLSIFFNLHIFAITLN
jgi:legumain